MYFQWHQLTPYHQAIAMWKHSQNPFSGTNPMTGYSLDQLINMENEYKDYTNKQAEIERIKRETDRLQRQSELTSEVSKQDKEKQRRTDEANASLDSKTTNGNNRSMLSGLTGFAKIRRKVLGSVGEVGSTDEKLGG